VTLAPLLTAPFAIKIHVAFSVAALLAGAAIAVMRKGTARHRGVGRFGVLMLALAALTSFAIYRNGFSLIHGLSILSLASLAMGIVRTRNGDRRGHRGYMTGAWLGLVAAAIGTLAPGRIMHAVVFAGLAPLNHVP